MIVPERLADRIKVTGVSYTSLAKSIGVKQPTITRLVKGEQRSTARIDLLAAALKTSPAYLTGEIDDPDADAPQTSVDVTPARPIMMPVMLPSERALSHMFRTMLRLLKQLPDEPDDDERARLLAQWLPIGLSQLRDLLPEDASPARRATERELAEALATDDH